MKKALISLTLAGIILLASCGKNVREKSIITKEYADSVNSAAATTDTSDDYTYEKIYQDFGKPARFVNLFGVETEPDESSWYTGGAYYFEGCSSMEEAQEKVEDGKSVPYIVFTLQKGIVTSAVYGVWDSEHNFE